MELINPQEIVTPVAAYSHGASTGNMVFVAGEVSLGPDGQLVGAGDVAAQTRQVAANVEAVLKTAGASLKDVVYTTVYLKDFKDYREYDEAYDEAFGGHKPARATVRADLVKPEFLVEIQAIAVKGAA